MHIAIVGSCSNAHGFLYMLTIVDVLVLWTLAFPILVTSAKKIADIVMDNWIYTYGMKSVITTDRSFNLYSSRNLSTYEVLNISQQIAYHSCDNGIVGKFQRDLKSVFTTKVDPYNRVNNVLSVYQFAIL